MNILFAGRTETFKETKTKKMQGQNKSGRQETTTSRMVSRPKQDRVHFQHMKSPPSHGTETNITCHQTEKIQKDFAKSRFLSRSRTLMGIPIFTELRMMTRGSVSAQLTSLVMNATKKDASNFQGE